MLEIAVCDDSLGDCAALCALLKAALGPLHHNIAAFSNEAALLGAIERGASFDLLFLDVMLIRESGIALARRINRLCPPAQIVFVSAYPAYALDAYEAEHIYFLAKPISPEKLALALDMAQKRIAGLKNRRLTLPVRGRATRVVTAGAILCCERAGHATVVRMTGGESLVTTQKLSSLENALPHALFARPHNSFLVNLSGIKCLTRTAVELADGSIVPISNRKRAEFLDAVAAYV